MSEKKLPRKERRRLAKERGDKWGIASLSNARNAEEVSAWYEEQRRKYEAVSSEEKAKRKAEALTCLALLSGVFDIRGNGDLQ